MDRREEEIFHLQYADDTIIFCPEGGFLANWWLLVKSFRFVLGLSFNVTKTSLIGITI